MGNKKKFVFEALFLLLVFGGTVYGVFHDQDLGRCLRIIREVEKLWLIPAAVCVLCFVGGESLILRYLLKTLGIRLKRWTCFLLSGVGFFFSCVTPSASGGQPAQVYFMRRKRIPIPVSTLVLLVVTIVYKSVLVFLGLGMLVFARPFIREYLGEILPVFYLGIALNVVCVASMLLLVFDTSLAKAILEKTLLLLEKLRIIPRRKSLHQRVEGAVCRYQEATSYFKDNRHVVVRVVALTFLQRLALFLSTYFVYRAFGLGETPVLTIVLLQAAISISVDMLPLPGGMGISESLFLTIFVPVFGAELLLPGMVLSRGISYYTQLLLCAALTVAAHFTIKADDN